MPKIPESKKKEEPKVSEEPKKVETKPTPKKGIVETELKVASNGSVTVSYGVTKNMGDYNSARIDATVTLPFSPTAEDLKEAEEAIKIGFEVVERVVEEKIAELMD